jgi:hypothetical protein
MRSKSLQQLLITGSTAGFKPFDGGFCGVSNVGVWIVAQGA